MSCTSFKRQYDARQDALDALKRCVEQGRPERHAYRCRFCSCWHLTSQDQSGRRRNREGVAM